MNILILGSTGFIGKNLLKKLIAMGYNVFTAERSSGVDLRSYEQVISLLRRTNPEVVFNLASHGGSVHYVKTFPADVFFDNVQMSLNLYKAISEINPSIKIIQPLSNCSYPGDSQIQKEEEWLSGDVHPSVFSFGNSKRSVYYGSKCYRNQYGIKTINMIFPNTYGPGDSTDPNHTHALNGMAIRMLKAKISKDRKFFVWGTGAPIREWVYIDDFIEVLVRCLKIEAQEYPVNVGHGRGYSIADSAALIKRACGFNGQIVFDTKYKDGDPIKIVDGSRFKNLFKDFEFYDHFKGIENTIRYYEKLI
tara:strand:- start:1289 stop:2206 length:918 start_codon:yes stop_codon:yes gene_type:complete